MAYINIYGTLTNATPEGKLAEALQIFDNNELKNLQTLNTELKESIESKVDKESGKSLVSDTLITKLEGLSDLLTINSAIADAKKAGTDASNLATLNKNTIDNYTINGLKISTNPNLSKNDVGLSNVTNEALIPLSLKGIANGVATLDDTGKVPSSLLPSYVDDVLEYDTYESFPETGESGKIYIDKQTNKQYRWGGTAYTEISKSLALGETSSTAYPGDKGKLTTDTLNSHIGNTSNPHNVTKALVGLGNVDNTSDLNKPISTATLAALDLKADKKGLVGKVDPTSDGTGEVFNDYENNIASGKYSHAEGYNTIASGNYSYALGILTEARGTCSYIEGGNVTIIYLSGESNTTKYELDSTTGWLTKCLTKKELLNYFNLEGMNVWSTSLLLLALIVSAEYDEELDKLYINLDKTLSENEALNNSKFGIRRNNVYGKNSHAEGYSNYCLSQATTSHIEGTDNTIDKVQSSHIEGTLNYVKGVANDDCIHVEGFCNTALNLREHAQGLYNKSNTGSTAADKTIHSIGVGTKDVRRNAQEVMGNGDHYIIGIGGYDGTNPTTSQTVLEIIRGKSNSIWVTGVGTSGEVTQELSPNTFYKFGECSTLTITLGAEIPNIYNEYMFLFTSGAKATVLTVPETVKWIGDHTVDINKTYLVSIVNNIGVLGGA